MSIQHHERCEYALTEWHTSTAVPKIQAEEETFFFTIITEEDSPRSEMTMVDRPNLTLKDLPIELILYIMNSYCVINLSKNQLMNMVFEEMMTNFNKRLGSKQNSEKEIQDYVSSGQEMAKTPRSRRANKLLLYGAFSVGHEVINCEKMHEKTRYVKRLFYHYELEFPTEWFQTEILSSIEKDNHLPGTEKNQEETMNQQVELLKRQCVLSVMATLLMPCHVNKQTSKDCECYVDNDMDDYSLVSSEIYPQRKWSTVVGLQNRSLFRLFSTQKIHEARKNKNRHVVKSQLLPDEEFQQEEESFIELIRHLLKNPSKYIDKQSIQHNSRWKEMIGHLFCTWDSKHEAKDYVPNLTTDRLVEILKYLTLRTMIQLTDTFTAKFIAPSFTTYYFPQLRSSIVTSANFYNLSLHRHHFPILTQITVNTTHATEELLEPFLSRYNNNIFHLFGVTNDQCMESPKHSFLNAVQYTWSQKIEILDIAHTEVLPEEAYRSIERFENLKELHLGSESFALKEVSDCGRKMKKSIPFVKTFVIDALTGNKPWSKGLSKLSLHGYASSLNDALSEIRLIEFGFKNKFAQAPEPKGMLFVKGARGRRRSLSVDALDQLSDVASSVVHKHSHWRINPNLSKISLKYCKLGKNIDVLLHAICSTESSSHFENLLHHHEKPNTSELKYHLTELDLCYNSLSLSLFVESFEKLERTAPSLVHSGSLRVLLVDSAGHGSQLSQTTFNCFTTNTSDTSLCTATDSIVEQCNNRLDSFLNREISLLKLRKLIKKFSQVEFSTI